MGLDAEGPAAVAADSGGFGAKAANGTLRPTESAAHNTEYLMNMGYDKAYAEVTYTCPPCDRSGFETVSVPSHSAPLRLRCTDRDLFNIMQDMLAAHQEVL